jgi:transglutaminase-like putative cysteine protease
VSRYRDYWGTGVHVFDLHRPHTELMVTATSLVETPAYAAEPVSATVPWETYTWDSVTDRYCEYLSFTDCVNRDGDLCELARRLRGASTPGRAVADVVEMLHADFAYVPGSTNVTTSAPRS